jgi:hypothetical protein
VSRPGRCPAPVTCGWGAGRRGSSSGLWLDGRIFPLEPSEPLVALAAIANFGVGVPWLLARMFDLGAGTVTAVTYEYGNSFLIVAGLLNFLVILDAYDIAAGRK